MWFDNVELETFLSSGNLFEKNTMGEQRNLFRTKQTSMIEVLGGNN